MPSSDKIQLKLISVTVDTHYRGAWVPSCYLIINSLLNSAFSGYQYNNVN